MSNVNEDREIIRVVYNEGEVKPWELEFEDLSPFKHARAILNYPIHKFETEEKAVEVAEMLRDIVKADAVEVEGLTTELDDVQPAEFFHSVQEEASEDELVEEPTLADNKPLGFNEPAPLESEKEPVDANVVPVITTTKPETLSRDDEGQAEYVLPKPVVPLPPPPVREQRPVPS